MVMPFFILLSTTGTNYSVMKFKKKRSIKHIVTISVVISILIALIIVTGIMLAFDLPPKNQKFTHKDNLSQEKENWKRKVHAVFAVNLIGPKDMRRGRSIENIKSYTLQVIRSLLFNYYGSDAQFVIQSYSVPGKTRISDFCDAACTMRHIDQIDQEATFIAENPNQTDAVWQYYHYSLGKKPSLYILFVADRASYKNDAMFEKDMENSSKVLEETRLIDKTETVLIGDVDAAQYFMYDSIISNGRSASEIANLINDRLISYYKNGDELDTVTTDSSQFIIPSITEEITLMSITDEKEEEESNKIEIQKIPSEEFAELSTVFDHDTGTKKQATKISSTSSTTKSNEAVENESSSIKGITQTSFDNNDSRNNSDQRMELGNEEEDFIIERKNMFIRLPTVNDTDSDILNDRHHVNTETTFILPFQWTGKNDSFEKMHKSMNTSAQLNPPPTDQIDDEIAGIRSSEHSEGKHDIQSEKSRSQDATNTDSFAAHIVVSPKFQTNDTVQKSQISEILDNLSNNVSSTMIITSMIDDDETTVDAEAVMSWEMDKNVSITTDFLEKKIAKHKKLTNLEQSSIIPELDINDFAYSLEPTSTSTNLDNLINFRKNFALLLSDKNNGSMKKNDELDSSFAQTNDEEIFETKENETELKESTISESMQRISTSRNDYFSNKKIKNNHRSSHILNLTETESSIKPMDNETSIFEVSEIISKDLSDASNSKTTMNPDVLETLQNDMLSNSSDENMGRFALEKNNSFSTTDLSAILTKSSPDLSETLTGTSLSTSDKELLMTTGKPWLIDNLQQSFSTSNDLQISSSSQTADSLFEDSELSTFHTTMSSDDAIDVVGLISDTNQKISDSGSSNVPSATLITSSTIDEIITGDSFTIKSQTLLNHEISDSFDQSTESSNLNLENSIKFAETSMIKPENAVEEVKEIDNITTITDSEAKTTTSTVIPMAVFNITIPSSLFDPKFLRVINRTNKDYNYLLMDEVNYSEDNEEDLSKIDFNVDDEATILDDANETNNDLYSDHDNFLSVTDDTTLEYKFNLANLALTNMHEMNFQPKIEAKPIFNGFTQANIVVNQDRNIEDRHRIISSKDNASLLILTKGAIPISPLDKTQISMLSQDFAEFKIKTDDTISDNQESTTDKSKTDVTVSQIIDPIKFDLTTGILDESFSTQISAKHEAIAISDAENQRKILSLKHISTTSIPEVEEINRNHKKIIHQTSTKDSDSQSETDVIATDSSTNDESLSIARVNNNNITNTTNNTDKVSQFLSTEVKNSSSRQKSINEFLTWK